MSRSDAWPVQYELDADGNVAEVDELEVKPELTPEPKPEPEPEKPKPTVTRGRGRKRAAAADVDADRKSEIHTKPAKMPRTRTRATTAPQTPKTVRAPRTGGPGKRWTGPELELLFTHALQGGPPQSVWNDAIPGRTAQQCSVTWRNSILPFLKKCLHERGQAGAAGGGTGGGGGGGGVGGGGAAGEVKQE